MADCKLNIDRLILTYICGKRLLLLCEMRKYILENPNTTMKHYKTEYLKNTLMFMNNLKLNKNVYISIEGLSANKITVVHVCDLVKYLQKNLNDNEVQKDLFYILDRCNEIDTKYFVDLTCFN